MLMSTEAQRRKKKKNRKYDYIQNEPFLQLL